jgi:hypothetical protein
MARNREPRAQAIALDRVHGPRRASRAASASWASLGGLLLSLAAPPATAQGTIESLAGPAGRAWASVDPEAAPARLAPEDLPHEPEAWRTSAPWQAWAELLTAEAEALAEQRAPDARRRARLALVAWSQNRSDDAWDHLASTVAEPAWMAAVVPHLAPGVPLDWLAQPDHDPRAPLPDGIHLRPALPPAPVPAAEVVHGLSRVDPRELRVQGVAIGAGVVDVRIALEVDGVQVDVEHVSGGPVSLLLTLPEPIDFEIKVEYLNWMRLDEARQPIEVRVDADEQRAFVFGRFLPRILPWSETLPAAPSARLERHGVQLRLPPGADATDRLRGFAAALRTLFGWEAAVLNLDPAQAPEPWPGIVMTFGPEPELERKFTGLVSLVEHYALGRAGVLATGKGGDSER